MRLALRAREVQVPDLTNRTANEATAMASDLGLTLQVDETRRPDPKIRGGQRARAGAAGRIDGARAAQRPRLAERRPARGDRAGARWAKPSAPAQLRLAQDGLDARRGFRDPLARRIRPTSSSRRTRRPTRPATARGAARQPRRARRQLRDARSHRRQRRSRRRASCASTASASPSSARRPILASPPASSSARARRPDFRSARASRFRSR